MRNTPSSSRFRLFFFLFVLLSTPFVAFGSGSPLHEDFLPCLTLNSTDAASASRNIYTPSDSTYLSVLDISLQNLLYRTRSAPKPLVIVTAVDVSQVKATVYCSSKHGLQLLVRSGGHTDEGLSYTSSVPFVILDMVNLRTITVDAENATAWVGAGATLGEVYYRIGEKSKTLAFPAGICPTIGIGGHASGGGYGLLKRKYGLAADNVIDAQIVDVNGKLLDRDSMGEDLFWAIRGGGGGTFGVVVAWKIRLVSVPETVTVFSVARTLEQNVTSLVHMWQQIAPQELPNEITISVLLNSIIGADGNRTIQATFQALYLGGTNQLLDLMASSFPELGLTREDCIETRWVNATLLFAGVFGQPLELLLNRTSNNKAYFKNKSDYVKAPISEPVLEEMWKWLHKEDPGSGQLTLSPYGGRMSEISESSIPFPHRAGNLYMIQYLSAWINGSAEESNRHISWIREFYGFMKPYVSNSPRSAYVNYRDLDIGMNNKFGKTSYKKASIWGTKYFHRNFDRLVRVKTVIDPTNFFRNSQSVPPYSS